MVAASLVIVPDQHQLRVLEVGGGIRPPFLRAAVVARGFDAQRRQRVRVLLAFHDDDGVAAPNGFQYRRQAVGDGHHILHVVEPAARLVGVRPPLREHFRLVTNDLVLKHPGHVGVVVRGDDPRRTRLGFDSAVSLRLRPPARQLLQLGPARCILGPGLALDQIEDAAANPVLVVVPRPGPSFDGQRAVGAVPQLMRLRQRPVGIAQQLDRHVLDQRRRNVRCATQVASGRAGRVAHRVRLLHHVWWMRLGQAVDSRFGPLYGVCHGSVCSRAEGWTWVSRLVSAGHCRYQRPPYVISNARRRVCRRAFAWRGQAQRRQARQEGLQIRVRDNGAPPPFAGDQPPLSDGVVNRVAADAGHHGGLVDRVGGALLRLCHDRLSLSLIVMARHYLTPLPARRTTSGAELQPLLSRLAWCHMDQAGFRAQYRAHASISCRRFWNRSPRL